MCPFWAKQAELSWGGYTAEKNPTRKKTSNYQEKEIERKKENLHLFPLCKLKANWTTCKGNQKTVSRIFFKSWQSMFRQISLIIIL